MLLSLFFISLKGKQAHGPPDVKLDEPDDNDLMLLLFYTISRECRQNIISNPTSSYRGYSF